MGSERQQRLIQWATGPCAGGALSSTSYRSGKSSPVASQGLIKQPPYNLTRGTIAAAYLWRSRKSRLLARFSDVPQPGPKEAAGRLLQQHGGQSAILFSESQGASLPVPPQPFAPPPMGACFHNLPKITLCFQPCIPQNKTRIN